MTNMRFWDAAKRPPTDALKTIGGGRLKNMTDINPQWRIEMLTELFGPCGQGWRYEIVRVWREDGSNGVVFAFAHINLYWSDVAKNTTSANSWSEPIPGIGGSQLIERERDGLYNDDEAYKMAITDALSVACKMLGVGAEIYRGRWDGSKYRDPIAPAETKKTGTVPTSAPTDEQSAARASVLAAVGNAGDEGLLTADETSEVIAKIRACPDNKIVEYAQKIADGLGAKRAARQAPQPEMDYY